MKSVFYPLHAKSTDSYSTVGGLVRRYEPTARYERVPSLQNLFLIQCFYLVEPCLDLRKSSESCYDSELYVSSELNTLYLVRTKPYFFIEVATPTSSLFHNNSIIFLFFYLSRKLAKKVLLGLNYWKNISEIWF